MIWGRILNQGLLEAPWRAEAEDEVSDLVWSALRCFFFLGLPRPPKCPKIMTFIHKTHGMWATLFGTLEV